MDDCSAALVHDCCCSGTDEHASCQRKSHSQTIEELHMGKEKSIDVSYDKDTNTELNKVKDVFEVKEVLARLNKPFVLVKLLQGLDLQAMDFNGKSDPVSEFGNPREF